MGKHSEDWQSQHDMDKDGLLTVIGNIDGPNEGRYTFDIVCTVDADNGDWQANLKLILAAPHLLKSLQGLLLSIEGDGRETDYPASIRVARAAIARATT